MVSFATELGARLPTLDALTTGDLLSAASALPERSILRNAAEHLLETRGKQLRSSIVLEASKYGGRRDESLARRAAIAVEVFHTATLAHDDVFDDGTVRRGAATLPAAFGPQTASLAASWLFGCGSMG